MFVDEKAAGEAKTAEQANRKYKLSEAIRIGARLRPQGFGGVLFQRRKGVSCALLAAYEAEKGYPAPTETFASADLSDWASARFGEDMRIAVMTKNDAEGCSREEIAD